MRTGTSALATLATITNTHQRELHLTSLLALNVAYAKRCAFHVQLEHLDGHKVHIKTEGVTKPGEVRIIKGEGMPLFEGGKRRGDLSVTHSILFPKSLTEAEKATAKALLTDKVHDEL